MRCTARTRSQPVTSGRSGWLRCSSSERKLTTTSTRAARSARTSRATRSSVERSRPVQILDHEHQRAVGGEPLDHAHDELEQARRAALAERSRAERAVGVEVGQHAAPARAAPGR